MSAVWGTAGDVRHLYRGMAKAVEIVIDREVLEKFERADHPGKTADERQNRPVPGAAAGGVDPRYGEGRDKSAPPQAAKQAHEHDFKKRELWPEIPGPRLFVWRCACGETGYPIFGESA